MRVSTSMIYSQGLTNLQKQQGTLLKKQQEISSGVKLNTPADNPVAFASASRLSVKDSQLSQYQTNIDNATGKIQVQESTLGSVTTMLQRVKSIAVQANNGAHSATSRAALVDELQQLKSAISGQANATDERGEYLFSGTAARAKPYDATGAINPKIDPTTAQGANAGPVNLQIAEGRSVETSRLAGGIFSVSSSASGTPAGGAQSVMQVIDTLSQAITNQPANVQTVYQNTQSDLNTIMNQVTDARGKMGNSLNMLDQAKNDNSAESLVNKQTLSSLRDTDMASAITKLNQSYMNLQATQQSMAKIQGLSLFNYIN